MGKPPEIILQARLDQEALARAEEKLNEAELVWAGADAVARATRWAQGQIIDGIYERYTLKKRDIRNKVRREFPGALEGKVEVPGFKLSLIKFQHRPRSRFSALTRKPRGGVTVQIKRSGGPAVFLNTFVERGRKTGRLFIMRRPGPVGDQAPQRAYIKYGSSLSHGAEKVLSAIEPEVQKRLQERFLSNLQYKLTGKRI